ncbi:MAG: hypothetical protein ABIB43_04890 [archaeon]
MRVLALFSLVIVALLISCSTNITLQDRVNDALVGKNITHYSIAGVPLTHVIEESDIGKAENALYQKQEYIRVKIGQTISWNLYLDKETLEIIHTEQLFVT